MRNQAFRLDSLSLTAALDPVTGNALKTAIDHREQALRQSHLDDEIRSTVGQRRAAALLELIACGFARNDGTMPVPMINIVMSQSVAEATVRALADEMVDYPDIDKFDFDFDGRCSFVDGTPLHPHHTFPTTAAEPTHHRNAGPACGADNGWKSDDPNRRPDASAA